MVLVRPDETHADAGVGGLRSLLRALVHSGLPVVFGPGVIHLPSVPRAPQVQPDRHGDRGQGVRGGLRDRRPVGAPGDRSPPDLDGPAGARRRLHRRAGHRRRADRRRHGRIVGASRRACRWALWTARSPTCSRPCCARTPCTAAGPWIRPGPSDDRPGRAVGLGGPRRGWTALLEAAAKAVRALLVSVPDPREIVVSGRLARLPALVEALGGALGGRRPGGPARARPGQRGRARWRAPRRCAGGRPPRRAWPRR